MTNPTPPLRPSMPRSSFAMAMKDYTFIRPGIAVTISASTLLAALIIGILHIAALRRAAGIVTRGAQTSEILHRYNARWEVYRGMMVSTDPAYQTPQALAQRDSLRTDLQGALARLDQRVTTQEEKDLISQVLEGLAASDQPTVSQARQALVVLLAKQDGALFEAAEESQRGVLLAALLLALTILAAGMMIVPMAWLYVRFKRGATIEVKI